DRDVEMLQHGTFREQADGQLAGSELCGLTRSARIPPRSGQLELVDEKRARQLGICCRLGHRWRVPKCLHKTRIRDETRGTPAPEPGERPPHPGVQLEE